MPSASFVFDQRTERYGPHSRCEGGGKNSTPRGTPRNLCCWTGKPENLLPGRLCSSGAFKQLEGRMRCVEIREDKYIGTSAKGTSRSLDTCCFGIQCSVDFEFAVDLRINALTARYSLASPVAAATFCTAAWVALPRVEKLTIATRGRSGSSAAATLADSTAIMASCETVGEGMTAQSASTSVPPHPISGRSGRRSGAQLDTASIPGSLRMRC